MPAATITTLERNALVTAYQQPNHTLRRFGGAFVAAPVVKHSGPTHVHAVTKRMALRLQRAALVQLDDDHCPASITLTDHGCALARELLREAGNG